MFSLNSVRPVKRLIAMPLLVIGISGCGQKFTVVKARPIDRSETAEERTDEGSDVVAGHMRDGMMLYRDGRFEAARNHFEAAVKADSTAWRGHYYLGLVLSQQEEYEAAERHLLFALDFAPEESRTRSSIYRAIAENYERQGMLSHAALNYRTALNLFPESAAARDGLSRVQQ